MIRARRVRAWLPYAMVLIAAAASLLALAVRPAAGPAKEPLDYVVVAGAAGLRWDDLDPGRTPNMWALAGKGSVGWLSVRSAHRVTCPADGWLTLGAGKELWDMTGRGDPSWRDFTWDVLGTAVGVALAVGVDALVSGSKDAPAEHLAQGLVFHF